jgi:hypothetical protein
MKYSKIHIIRANFRTGLGPSSGKATKFTKNYVGYSRFLQQGVNEYRR